MKSVWKDWKRIYKSNTNLQLKLKHSISFKYCLLKVLKFLSKNNANNKISIKIFINEILHLKLINNKKQVIKQNVDEV